MAAPGIIRDRACVPDQPGGFLHLGARDAADRLDSVGRVAPAEPRIELEDRVAEHLAFDGGDGVFPFEREARILAIITTGASVIRYWPGPRAGPVRGAPGFRAPPDAPFGQQPAGVGAHQERPVAPLADEFAVVPAALDH